MSYTVVVSQLNIHVTSSFERALSRFMKLRGLTSKSEAVRVAVEEAAAREAGGRRPFALGALRGAALGAPPNPNPRFQSEDDLWG
jgi:hypothetical protein